MFDIKFFVYPGRLARLFLNTNRVADQRMGGELRNALDILKETGSISPVNSFWGGFLQSFRRLIFRITLFRTVGTLSLLFGIFASRQILDGKRDLLVSLFFIFAYLVCHGAEVVFSSFSRRYQQEAGSGIKTMFITLVNRKLLDVDLQKCKSFSSGNLKVLISSDAERVSQFIITVLWNFMPAVLCLFILGPVIIHEMGVAGMVAVLSSFMTVPVIVIIGRYTSRQEIKMKTSEDHLASIIGEWVSHVRIVRYLGLDSSFKERIRQCIRKYTIESGIQHLLFILGYGMTFVWWLMPILLMLVTERLMNQQSDLKTVFSVIWMLNHMQGFVKFMPSAILQYNSAHACIDRLRRFLAQPELKDRFLPDYPESIHGRVPVSLVMEGVSFAYNGTPVIRNMTARFDLKEKVSVIGRVGSGKSTLLRLLSGELKPDTGRISLLFDDGKIVDIWHRNIHSYLKALTSYVGQEPYLSNMSLSGNISLDDGYDSDRIMSDLYFAGLEADVAMFENGISEEIGENGINLSGGQKQRVNLARGFYADRSFAFLDDPLSAVDSEMESFLIDGIMRNMKAFILVSHRLSFLEFTDRLIVLDNGKIIRDESLVKMELFKEKSLLEYMGHPNGPTGKSYGKFYCK